MNRTHPDSGHITTSSDVIADLHDEIERLERSLSHALAAAARSGWLPIESAPKEVELLGWREDCGPLLIMHTSYDRFASERECDETDEETLFQKDWFGASIPGGFQRLEGSETPTHYMPLPPPPSTKGEPA